MTSKLYMIATPLGNLEDLTLRAQRLFNELSIFFAEDSREFKKLLNALDITLQDKRIFSYASHNMKEATAHALDLLQSGKSVGLVSDRGTPGISDPGAYLVKAAYEAGFQIVPVPGASAVPALISASGLLETRFYFSGFLPSTLKAREELFTMVSGFEMPFCFFESPHRMRATLKEIKEKFPSGRIFVGRELTKVFETLTWHELKSLDESSFPEQGEYSCLLVPGVCGSEGIPWQEEVLLRFLPEKEWAKKIASRYGCSSSEIYNALQQLKSKKI